LLYAFELDSPSAANEVHDDGDQGKEEQQVNQEAADVQNKESAKPKQNQHHSENEKHEKNLLSSLELSRRRDEYQVI
jgi:hypothetical protein